MEGKEDAALSSNSGHIEVAANSGDGSPTPMKGFEDVPETDVNDPLNWPTKAKLVTYLSICAFTFLANVNSSNFTVAVVPIMAEFHVSSTKAGYLVCFNVFLFGAGNLFWVPLMRVIGKRPVYLLSMVILSMMNVWSTQVDNFEELLAARILSGFAASAADATVPGVVSDMIPISKRGHYLMFFHLAMSCGLFLGPLMNAFIIQQEGWRWMCHLLAVAVGILFVVSVFTIRETSYLRQRDANQEIIDAPRTQIQWMSVTYGYNKNASFWGSMMDILVNATYPPILWCSVTVGICVGSIIVIQLTSSRTFPPPPYNWDLGNLGLFSIAGWIGACVAFYFGGRLIDTISSRAALKRGGQWRPENRLPAIFIPGVIGPAGLLIFGLCIAHKTHWIGPAFGFAMQAFGITAVSNVTVTYIVDSYKPIAGEALVIIFIARNTTGMLISLYTADWIEAQSATLVFGEMAAVQAAAILLAIPFFVWAQSIHVWTCSFGPMKRTLELEDRG